MNEYEVARPSRYELIDVGDPPALGLRFFFEDEHGHEYAIPVLALPADDAPGLAGWLTRWMADHQLEPLMQFGYNEVTVPHRPYSMQVAESKSSDTLEPLVLARFRFEQDGPQLSIGIDPDRADFLADELHRWAQRAREKHYE